MTKDVSQATYQTVQDVLLGMLQSVCGHVAVMLRESDPHSMTMYANLLLFCFDGAFVSLSKPRVKLVSCINYQP